MTEMKRYRHAPRLVDMVMGQPAPMPPGEYVLASDYATRAVIVVQVARLREALTGYAECTDGCTCGDGWGHETAQQALRETEAP